jgi:patatin-like phospholipase/acyl hydrolase
LKEIEKRLNKPITDYFDLIGANSTGGIIAMLLTKKDNQGYQKYSCEDIYNFYIHFGKNVFKKNIFRKIITLNGLIKSKHSPKVLEEYLQDYLENDRLNDTLVNVVVPSYNISSRSAWFFKTTYAKQPYSKKDNPYMWEVARCTSSAPTFFPAYKLDDMELVDGGLVANNPTMCAYAQAKNDYDDEELFILSIGSGIAEKEILNIKTLKNGGIFQWAKSYFSILSPVICVDYQLKTISKNNTQDIYYRLQPIIPKECDSIDNISNKNLESLKYYTQKWIYENNDLLDIIVKKINRTGGDFKNSKS